MVPDTEFFALPVRSDEQVAAVRVFTDDGEVDQIYVASEYRRLHVAAKLIRVASAFHMAHGWNGLLHRHGRRTDLGEGSARCSRGSPNDASGCRRWTRRRTCRPPS